MELLLVPVTVPEPLAEAVEVALMVLLLLLLSVPLLLALTLALMLALTVPVLLMELLPVELPELAREPEGAPVAETLKVALTDRVPELLLLRELVTELVPLPLALELLRKVKLTF